MARDFCAVALADLTLSVIKPSLIAASALSFSLENFLYAQHYIIPQKDLSLVKYIWEQYILKKYLGSSALQMNNLRNEILRRMSTLHNKL